MDKTQYNQLFIAKLWSKWSIVGQNFAKQAGRNKRAEEKFIEWFHINDL